MRSLGIGVFFGIGEDILNQNNQERLDAQKRSPAPRTSVRGAGDLNSFLREALAEHLTIVLVDVLTSLLCRLEGIPLHSLETAIVLIELGDVNIDVHQ